MKENRFLKRAKAVAQKMNEGTRPLVSKTVESAGKLACATSKKYEESSVKDKVDSFANATSKKYEESGTKDKVNAVTGKISEQFDVVSGQAMFLAVQEYIAKQDQFNDVLANKLQEALDRIKQLEEKIGCKE